MLKRHQDFNEEMAAASAEPKLKALSPGETKRVEEIKKEIEVLEKKLGKVLGVTCKLKIYTQLWPAGESCCTDNRTAAYPPPPSAVAELKPGLAFAQRMHLEGIRVQQGQSFKNLILIENSLK